MKVLGVVEGLLEDATGQEAELNEIYAEQDEALNVMDETFDDGDEYRSLKDIYGT